MLIRPLLSLPFSSFSFESVDTGFHRMLPPDAVFGKRVFSTLDVKLAMTEAVFGMFYVTLMIARLVPLYTVEARPMPYVRVAKLLDERR